MKKLIQLKLKYLAKIILKKYKPEIIAITGSVGKTIAKEAIYQVLAGKFNVRRSLKNYNNEIGVPLTIIGIEAPGKNLLGWISVIFKACNLILFKDNNYPKILILEMGIDRPGDMKYLMSIAKPDIGVLTTIGDSHFEYFENKEKLKKEKGLLIKNVNNEGWAVINYDNKDALSVKEKSQSKILTYGTVKGADVWAQEIKMKGRVGMIFKLAYSGSFVPVLISGALGLPIISAALAGAAVGIAKGMNLVEVSQELSNLRPPKGRLNLIKGIKNTLIIDDTYNSSPDSAKAAVKILVDFPVVEKGERCAVLGDMLELGSVSEVKHQELGAIICQGKIDKLITVGEKSRDIGRGAEDSGMNSDIIFSFDNCEEAGKFIQNRIKKNDVVLVKGSQGMRMEKIVKEIMADPLRAAELLVRQEKEWQG